MARIQVFQGGNIQRNMPTSARFRPADYGPGALTVGLQQAGRAIGEYAQKQDEIEDVKARVEANKLAIEHNERARQVKQRVTQTLGDGAEAAAEEGAVELEDAARDVLGRASPRAKLLLEGTLAEKVGQTKDTLFSHGFREKVNAFEDTSVARINSVVEAASDEDDEASALAMLDEVRVLNEQRAGFFGKGQDWLASEDRKVISTFYKSRALKLAAGPSGSALAAIEYATSNRGNLSDDDYNGIVSAYNDNALDEMATSIVDGAQLPTATVEERDPLAPLEEGEEPQQTRFLDPKAFFKSFTVPHEGSTYVIDSNGAGVKYGINAAYNPGVDVKSLTEAQAAEIFRKKYFEKSGADKLPPALAAVHVDTFYLNEREATRMLKESGGDVDRYIQLRRNFLNGLVRKNPGKFGKYQRGWENRTTALAEFANRQGTDGTPMPVDPGDSLDGFRERVMQRNDIGLALKRKLIQRAEQRRSDERQERAIVEDEASRELTTAITALGQNFTDVKQLPQDAWLQASPATRASLTEAAKSNVQNKPVPLNVEAQIGFIQTFAPEKLADPKVLEDLAAKGVPASRLADLARTGGAAMGQGVKPGKIQPVSSSQLEAIARPAFEAQGLFLWTIEEGKHRGKKEEERKSDAQRQIRAMGMLRGYANQWAANNPGKTADEATIRGWVANVSRRVQYNGEARPFFDLSDDQLILSMSEADRRSIVRKLMENGLPAQPELIADYYRRLYVGRQR